MRLSELGFTFGDDSGSLRIADFSHLSSMAIRIIEDLDVGAYAVAKVRESRNAMEAVESWLRIVDPEFEAGSGNDDAQGFVSYPIVEALLRAPINYDERSIRALTRFVNREMFRLLEDGARRALGSGSNEIKQSHLLPYCEHWPYPLNRYC